MIRSCLGLLATLSLACAGTEPAAEPGLQGASVRLQQVAEGLVRPLHLVSPPGDPRLFIVEQPGRIRIVREGRLLDTPFLDVASRVRSTGNEQGLLSLAFHPGYADNGYFYVNYTDLEGDTRVERYRVSGDPDVADPGSASLVLAVDQPYGNHNGGHIVFGPDGMLYVAMGDGGSANDPQGNGQNLGTLLGKLLRIDVDGAAPYGVPAGNPFVGRAGARPEIWAYGLRNPWRIDFDEPTGDLYIADVGQNAWEEIHVAPAAAPGLNYGWNRMEGTHCFRGDGCDRAGLVIPVLDYPHPDGCSVTGGYVYRGTALPALVGQYFYGDFCGGWVRSFRYSDGRATDQRSWPGLPAPQILSFGEDSQRELYLLLINGTVQKMVPE